MVRLSLLLLAATLVACTSETPVDDDDTVDEHQAQETACDLAAEAGTALVGVTGLNPDPGAAMTIDDGPYTIDLVDGDHSFVNFEAAADDNEVILFLGAADALENVWETDHIHGNDTPAPNPDCPELIPAQVTLELHAGQWYVEIGVIDVDPLWMHLGTGAEE